MILPRGDEYNIAVQNPKISFTDADLKSSSVEQTLLGLPKPYSGGFTITYKLSNSQNGWAVRCFHKDIQDLQRRYQTIGNFLSKNPSRYFVDAKYLSEGIKVNGKSYPIIKMHWLEGEPLNIYLSKEYNHKEKIEKILADFVNLINELERFGIAHGDLQHGNIIVKNDKLYLIDYDGMYFPDLASLKTNEIGHINYQHPKRTASHFNQNIDRFSAIVIYIGLKAISLNSDLWKKYDNSENILFKSKDFADLQNSALVQDLSAIPAIKPLIERLVGCCHLDFEKVPSLKDFLLANFAYNRSAVGKIAITRSQYEIIDSTKKGSLLEHFGEKVEVVGRISGKYNGLTYNGSPYMFLNFGLYPNQTFTIVVWSEGITALTAKGMSPTSLVGKYVSVSGVIGSYRSTPQMIIEQPNQIQLLVNETEANERLKFKTSPIINQSTPQAKKALDKDVDVFNNLYKNRPVNTQPKPVVTPTLPKPVLAAPTTPSTPKHSTTFHNSSNQTTKQTTNPKAKNEGGLISWISKLFK